MREMSYVIICLLLLACNPLNTEEENSYTSDNCSSTIVKEDSKTKYTLCTKTELLQTIAQEITAQGDNADLTNIDTSNITDMSRMFKKATAFNGDIRSWNTGKVTDMRAMFYEATAFNSDIGSWNTSNVTDMSYMVASNKDENENIIYMSFNQNIGKWNTSSGTTMSKMFRNAYEFNQNIGNWNTSKVTDMSYMFSNAYKFNQDLTNWSNVSNPTTSNMFNNSSAMQLSNKASWMP